MNPQYMNTHGPPQPGARMMPPGPQPPSMNGPYGQPPVQRPPGGSMPPVMKPAYNPIPNGPPGPQGDPYPVSNGYTNPNQPQQMPTRAPNSFPPPSIGGAPSSNQHGIVNQIGAMNISGQGQSMPPRPGMPPPTTFGQNPGMPPGMSMQRPPGSMVPPSVSQPPNNMPPQQMPGQGPGNMPRFSQQSNYPVPPPPQASIPGQPPPTSMSAAQMPNLQPPNSVPQMPPSNSMMAGPGTLPPNSMMGGPGTLPPNSMMGGPGALPPNSMMGGPGALPPNSMMGGPGALPPNSMIGGMSPPPRSAMGGSLPPQTMPPNSMMGAGMPPRPPGNTNYPPQQNYPQGPMTPQNTGGNDGFNYGSGGIGGGFPQQPDMGVMSGGPPGMPGQQQQSRKLDPDHMPSPIQVMETDKEARSGIFQTASRGQVPPLCTTSFIVEDMGNSSPRFLRSTMYSVPVNSDMLNTSKIPFAVTLSPFAKLLPAEHEPPIVDMGQVGPIRCNRCKAYMCPFMQFIDGGRRFQCAFCNCITDVPAEYFAHLDHTGRRTDFFDRPELCLGTYEFVATEDYCKNSKLPNPPAFIFMIDVSYNSVKTGLVNLWCDRLKEDVLKNLPKDYGAEESEIRVGFVTYHKELHFYNVKGSLSQPQMMVVSDIEDVFVPILDGFLVKLSESETVIDSLLSQIPQMFSESRETEIVLGPVIQAGLDALVSAECAGKLFIFHSSLPVAQAPGMLKNRDDRKVLGTDKEKSILTPQTNFYTKLGQECVAAGCSVELFLFPNSYIDLATVSEVSRLTGGGVHKYQYFQADLEGDRFMDDLRRQVEKPVGMDCVIRVRTSTGIRPVDFLGNFHMMNTTDMDLASIDCDKAVTVEIKHDDKLNEADGACLQAAVLYTSVGGKRRLRIINQSFTCCSQMSDLFKNVELDTLMNYMIKLALRGTLNGTPKKVREDIMNQCAVTLACYRQKCASPSSLGQLILPEGMKLLPVYSNCVLKTRMLQGGGDISTDERSLMMFIANALPVKNSQVYLYPRLIPLHNLDLESNSLPVSIRCSYERLQDNGAYLIENGLDMIMWVGLNIGREWLEDVFAAHSVAQIDIDKTRLQLFDNPTSKRIHSLIHKIREERGKFLKLIIVRQRDKLEPLFLQYLVEDRSMNAQASYVDFLCHIHKEIRNLLN